MPAMTIPLCASSDLLSAGARAEFNALRTVDSRHLLREIVKFASAAAFCAKSPGFNSHFQSTLAKQVL